MIDYLMLRGLKPLSQETDMPKEDDYSDYLKYLQGVSSPQQFSFNYSVGQGPLRNDDNEIQEEIVSSPVSPVEEPKEGSYYTDSHKPINKDEALLKSEEDRRLFIEAFPDSTPDDRVLDKGLFSLQYSVLNYHINRNIPLPDKISGRRENFETGNDSFLSTGYEMSFRDYLKQVVSDKREEYSLSKDVIASYEGGIATLKELGITEDQLSTHFGANFKNLSEHQKNLLLKKRIIQDIVDHSSPSESNLFTNSGIVDNNGKLKEDISEEALDSVYDTWMIEYGPNRLYKNTTVHDKDQEKGRRPFIYKNPSGGINQAFTLDQKDYSRRSLDPRYASYGIEVQGDPVTKNILNYRRKKTPTFLNETPEDYASTKISLLGENVFHKAFENSKNRQAAKKEQAAQFLQESLDNASEEEKQALVEEIKQFSREQVPYFFGKYENTPKLPLSDENYLEIAKKFQVTQYTLGTGAALKELSDTYQNIVADNTTWIENQLKALALLPSAALDVYGFIIQPIVAETGAAFSNLSREESYRVAEEGWAVMMDQGIVPTMLNVEESLQNYREGIPGAYNRVYSTDETSGFGKGVSDLTASVGYMIGFMKGGKTIGKMAGGMAKIGSTMCRSLATGSKAVKLEKMSNLFTNMAKAEAKAGRIIGHGILAHATADLEARHTRQEFRRDHYLTLNSQIKDQYYNETKAAILANPQQFIDAYEEQTGKYIVGHMVPSPFSEYGQKQMQYSEHDLKPVIDYFCKNEDRYQQYKQFNSEYRQKSEMIENAADLAYNTNYSLNVVTNLGINTAFRRMLIPKSMQRTFEGGRINQSINVLRNAGAHHATAKKMAAKTLAGSMLMDISGETIDEWKDEVYANISSGTAESALTQMIENRYGDTTTTAALNYEVGQALKEGFSDGVNSMLGEEVLLAGLYGGISAAIGVPTYNSEFNWSKRKQGETALQVIKRWSPLHWDSMLSIPFGANEQINQEQQRREDLATYVEAFFKDEKKQAMFQNNAHAVSLLRKLSKAEETGDTTLISEAEMELATSTMTFAASLKGTEYYDNISTAINARANFNTKNLADANSAENIAVDEYLKDMNIKGPVSREAALQGIIESAKQAQKMMQRAEQELADVYKEFGDDIDLEFAQDVVQNRLLKIEADAQLKEANARIDKLQGYFQSDPNKSSKLSSSAKSMAAKYGTGYSRAADGTKVYNVEKQLEDTRSSIAAAIAAIEANPELSVAEKKRKINRLNKSLEKVSKEVEKYREELEVLNDREKTLTAEEIFNLSIEEQALFLARTDHSKAQQQEINRLGVLKEEMLRRGKLYNESKRREKTDTELSLNPQYMMDFYSNAKTKARQKIFQIRYAHLNREGLSYEEFRSEFYKTQHALTSEADAQLLQETVQNNPHYQRLSQEGQQYMQSLQDVQHTKTYRELDKDPAKAANINALLAYLGENGIVFDTSQDLDTLIQQISSIPEQELQEAINRMTHTDGQYTVDTVENLAQMLKSIYNDINASRQEIESRSQNPQNVTTQGVSNTEQLITPAEEIEEENTDEGSNAKNTEDAQKESGEKDSAPVESSKENENKPKEKTEPKEPDSTSTDVPSTPTEESKKVDDPNKNTPVFINTIINETQSLDSANDQFTYNWLRTVVKDYERGRAEEGQSLLDYMTQRVEDLKKTDQPLSYSVPDAFNKIKKQMEKAELTDSNAFELQIEGFEGEDAAYMAEHGSYNTLATNNSIQTGSKIIFYTPKELSEKEGKPKVVALIQDEKGKVKINGINYSPIGFQAATPSMIVQYDAAKKGEDIVYKEEGTIETVEKEGFGRQFHHTKSDVPVKQAMTTSADGTSNGIKPSDAKKKFLERVKKKARNLVYPLTRGAGKTTVDVEISLTNPVRVKNEKGETVIDAAKTYADITEEKDKNTAAKTFKNYNEYTKNVFNNILEGIKGITKVISSGTFTDKEIESAARKLWKNINREFRVYGSDGGHTDYNNWTMQVTNIKNDESGVSFSLSLETPTGDIMHLADIQGLSLSNLATDTDAANVLTNLLLRTKEDGTKEAITVNAKSSDSWLQYHVQFEYEGKLATTSIGKAFDAGVLQSNKPSFDYPPVKLLGKINSEARKVTTDTTLDTEVISTDNASSAPTSSSPAITTTEGQLVNPDTGISIKENSSTNDGVIILSEETEEEEVFTPEETIEQSTKSSIESVISNPFGSTEEEVFDVGNDESMDDDDVDFGELQKIQTRQARIQRVQTLFKQMSKDVESREYYNDMLEEDKAENQKYTTSGYFSFKDAKSKVKAKAKAEAKAQEIRDQKAPHIRSVKVIENGNKGYSLQIKYNTYSRYLSLRSSEVESMTDSALRETLYAFSDKKSVFSQSKQEAQQQHSIFQKFSLKSIRDKFNSLVDSPISQKLENLLTDVLDLYGIKTMERDIKEANGSNIVGAINTVGNIIYLAKEGERNAATLPEETAHALLKHFLRNSQTADKDMLDLYYDIESEIVDNPIYQDVVEEYASEYLKPDGTTDFEKLRIEAVGKALATVISEKYDKNDSLFGSLSYLIDKLVLSARNLFLSSNTTRGKEAMLNYKLNMLASKLMDKDVKKVKQKTKKSAINSILEALGIDTKNTQKKSKARERLEEEHKNITMNSSSRTILFDFLNKTTQEVLNKKGINKEAWINYPMELQEQILKCLSRA